jgi:hypothetical protein
MKTKVLSNMRKLMVLAFCVMTVFMAGCETTLKVNNIGIDQMTPLFKDYAGLNGYQITYENSQTKSYRLSLGTFFVPHVSQSVETSRGAAQIDQEIPNQTNVTSYGQTIVQTINQPAHYVEAVATVRMMPQGEDVLIYIETGGAAVSLDDFQKYIKQTGYHVEVL